jgi:Pvc16 N-terminal domain/Carboxypeptidase regulatory-like domain
LRQLFLTTVSGITNPSQVSFEPPNDDFRGQVQTSGKMALNVYLADLRENRMYRTNERVRSAQNGIFSDAQAPRRVDCHYLISAWSPATASASVEPTVDEHLLLYQTMTALVEAEPFVPSVIYTPGTLPPYWSLIADEELPSVILPIEGFPKLAEFWGATKTVHWKPAVYLIVTLPVVMPALIAGPMVTAAIAEYELNGDLTPAEVLLQIGGSVITGTPPKPISAAWVQLESSAATPLTSVTTDVDGHFTFEGLRQGNYILRVRAQGFAGTTRTVTVPSSTGNYDVPLS